MGSSHVARAGLQQASRVQWVVVPVMDELVEPTVRVKPGNKTFVPPIKFVVAHLLQIWTLARMTLLVVPKGGSNDHH